MKNFLDIFNLLKVCCKFSGYEFLDLREGWFTLNFLVKGEWDLAYVLWFSPKKRFKRFFLPMPPHVHTDFVDPPPVCGRSVLTSEIGAPIGRSYFAPMMWVMICSTRRGLKRKFYRLPRSWSIWGSWPARENSHGRTGNRTRDLMASSKKVWPPSHEAGLG
jgi:hypothetical protein